MTSLHKLVILQNRAVRLISRANFRSSCDPLYARFKLLKVGDILKYQWLNLCLKLSIPLYHRHVCVMSRFLFLTVHMTPVKSLIFVLLAVAR